MKLIIAIITFILVFVQLWVFNYFDEKVQLALDKEIKTQCSTNTLYFEKGIAKKCSVN